MYSTVLRPLEYFPTIARDALRFKMVRRAESALSGNCRNAASVMLCGGLTAVMGKDATLSTLRQAHGRKRRASTGGGERGRFPSAIKLAFAFVIRGKRLMKAFGRPILSLCSTLAVPFAAKSSLNLTARLRYREVKPSCSCRISAYGIWKLRGLAQPKQERPLFAPSP